MTASDTGISAVGSIQDIERIELTPLAERALAISTYELIQHVAAENPSATAIRYLENGDCWAERGRGKVTADISYGEFLERIHQTANLLRTLDIKEHDCVSMVLPNVPEAHYVLWGAEACGIVNPINHMLEGREIGEIIASANSKVLVAYGAHPEIDVWQKLPAIIEAAPCIEQVVIVGGDSSGLPETYLDFRSAIAAQPSNALVFDRQWAADDTASLFHTGGTTGLPKLVRHTHGNEVYTAWAINSLADSSNPVCYLTGLPVFHCNAAIGSGLSVFARGGTVVLAGINGFRSPGIVLNFYRILSENHVTHFNLVPTVVGILTQLPCDEDVSSVEFAVCGAAPMPVDLFHRFQAHTGIRLLEGYGLTEATVCTSMTPPGASEPRIGSIGLRLPYTQMQVAKLSGDGTVQRTCAIDETGLLLISGPSVTPGYTDVSKSEELFVRDSKGVCWLNTGDLVRQDSEGYFWLTGREKELIIRGGHNIDPKAIEEVLAAHPAVNLVAAIGRPDTYAGEVPVAYVDTNADVSATELIEWCSERIGERAAIPKAVVILDQLPTTGIGKIHKPTLQLREIEWVVRQEVTAVDIHLLESALGETGARNIAIEAYPDKKFGNAVKITVPVFEPTGDSELCRQISQRLAAYSFKSFIEADPSASNHSSIVSTL